MHNSKIIFVINDNVRVVKCRYDPMKVSGSGDMLFKTLDKDIAYGDLLVVQSSTRYEATVVQVVETDMTVDLEQDTAIDWVISRIDTDNHDRILAMERDAIATVQNAERVRKREELRKSVLGDNVDIGALQITHAGGTDTTDEQV